MRGCAEHSGAGQHAVRQRIVGHALGPLAREVATVTPDALIGVLPVAGVALWQLRHADPPEAVPTNLAVEIRPIGVSVPARLIGAQALANAVSAPLGSIQADFELVARVAALASPNHSSADAQMATRKRLAAALAVEVAGGTQGKGRIGLCLTKALTRRGRHAHRAIGSLRASAPREGLIAPSICVAQCLLTPRRILWQALAAWARDLCRRRLLHLQQTLAPAESREPADATKQCPSGRCGRHPS
mmetsp:Transcript_37409/g.81626  ORF Transcript_37409/g.81626 Transcript_37409/m.81626 type:complete len:245 (-) Transcript_37409:8-742(-)